MEYNHGNYDVTEPMALHNYNTNISRTTGANKTFYSGTAFGYICNFKNGTHN